MRIDRTAWEPPPGAITVPVIEPSPAIDPPGFGIGVFWAVPAEWWKPFCVVRCWSLRIQIGWLID